MKNTILSIFFIVLLGQACHMGLPWWGLAPVAALAGAIFPQSGWRALTAGFAGGFLLWISAAFALDASNGGLLSQKIGQLFMGLSGTQILVLTGFIGGLVAAPACLTGRLIGSLLSNSKHSSKSTQA